MTTLANGREELPFTPAIPHEKNGVAVVYYRRWTGDHSHFSPRLLWNIFLYARRCPSIHIHAWWNLVSIPAVVLCLLRGRQPMVSVRGMLSPYSLRSPVKRLFHSLLGRFLLRRCMVHATSRQEAAHDLHFMPAGRVVVLPNIVSLPELPEHLLQRGRHRLLVVARVHPVKRLELLFEALASLPDYPWTLRIAGTGEADYIAQLRLLAETLGIAARMEWLGWVDVNEKQDLYHSSDLLLLVSHNENFANVALEALSMGTPALLTDTVGMSEYVEKRGYGYVCAGEAGAVAACLQRFFEQGIEVSRTEIATQVRKDFDPQRLSRKYIEVYLRLQQ
jgi:glycosyltransferase involved in cell wall biosynthesis